MEMKDKPFNFPELCHTNHHYLSRKVGVELVNENDNWKRLESDEGGLSPHDYHNCTHPPFLGLFLNPISTPSEFIVFYSSL